MAFDYFEHLSAKQKRTYRRSDAVARVEVPHPEELGAALERVRASLEADARARLDEAVADFAGQVLRQLDVPPVVTKVLSRRPSDAASELHGLYVRSDDEPPVIRIWMRTAANALPVKFRTFMRTLLHELLHHLDFELLKLADTFHTEGFFRRESDLVRQLLGEAREPDRSSVPERRRRAARERQSDEAQLSLFSES